MTDFYDQLSSVYHLVYQDWDHAIASQAAQLASIIETHWGAEIKSILDVSCGIGTQAIGLAKLGFQVTASDLSSQEIERATQEARQREVAIDFSVCDMRRIRDRHHRQFDLVLSCDNSIPHLLTDEDILLALQQMYACTRPGGGCLLTVRDYDKEPRGVGIVKPYGVREEQDKRYFIFQVWDFIGDVYDLSMYVVIDDPQSNQPITQVMRSKYYAIGTDQLLTLMKKAGFSAVERLDGQFFQPVLVGKKSL
ncbi:MAG: class I SAM-dependent methyltransferase [Leptolyngbyaceae cyanobacterium MO_188.B28]|nr:class I SAM-dependent methyltransferase [Leptolyngbyaceae cyanobacterium MO_188.B28]